jgi:hypothetical protein
MITRRSVLTMLPAGMLAGSSFISLARAQAPQKAAINPLPDAGRKIVARLEQWKGSPHYDATRALIECLERTAGLRGVRFASERRRNSKSELIEVLGQLNSMYTPVTTVLDIRKKTDEFIELDKKRGLAPAKKSEFNTKIAVNNARITDVLTELFKGGGDFDIDRVRKSPGGVAAVNSLISLTEDLLDTSIKLSEWGPDAFYSSVRGYVTFQFVRDRIRVGRSSPLLARAYVMRIIGDSESYFALRAASLTAAAPITPTTPTAPATTATTPARAITANARYSVEKEMIDRRFPKEIYLGSEMANRENGCGRDQVINHYGKFTADSNFDNSFRLEGADGWSASSCVSQINDRGAESLNGLLGSIFKQFAPTTGTEAGFKKTMRDTRDAMNDLIRRLKAAKQREDAATGQTPQQPAPPNTQPSGPEQEAQQEFMVMQQMTAALREMLAST